MLPQKKKGRTQAKKLIKKCFVSRQDNGIIVKFYPRVNLPTYSQIDYPEYYT